MATKKPTETECNYACRIWPMLVLAGSNAQILTYGDVGAAIGLPANGFGNMLDLISQYCEKNNLPYLNVNVVNQDTGDPGNAVRLPKGKTVAKARIEVALHGDRWLDKEETPAPQPSDFKDFDIQL